VATVTFKDTKYALYNTSIAKFDEIKIYFKDAVQTSWAQVFGGHIRQANPVSDSNNGDVLICFCKGHGAALEETHCNQDVGLESSHTDVDKVSEILIYMIDNFVNKSFADSATGYSIGQSWISNYADTTSIKYINNPYRGNMELADIVCNLTSAMGAGSTAGGHYIVDPSGAFLFGKIGDHSAGFTSPEEYWPDWWMGTEAASTIELKTFNVLDKTEEYANKVILVTDFRRPAYDYWTNGDSTALNNLWGASNATITGATSFGTHAHVVGNTALKVTSTTSTTPYPSILYPKVEPSAGWDITKLGSIRTIPKLNFYFYKPAGFDEEHSAVILANDTDNHFDCFFTKVDQTDGEWAHKSIPIGPYWATDEGNKEFKWTETGSPTWTNIKGLVFQLAMLTDVYAGIDDLHFTGKIVRSAYDSTDITAKGMEFQKVLIARNSMDDSCIANDTTGFAARIAYAELLRRLAEPLTISFTLTANSQCTVALMMAGEKIHVHACKRFDGSFAVDADMRVLQVQHDYNMQGLTSTVTATTDLLNSNPISVPDQYAMWQENMFVNSAEAKNIRAGAEVDLLIPQLEYDYG
jgi:hypothetical protein